MWRDAYNGRLEGIREETENYGIECSSVLLSKRGIACGTCGIESSDRGTGSRMKTWGGWLQQSLTIWKYELMSDGFVMEQKEYCMKNFGIQFRQQKRKKYFHNVEVPQQKYQAAHCSIGSTRALEHASFLVLYFIRRESESPMFAKERWKNDSEDVCSSSEKILTDVKQRNRSTALALHEIAASEPWNRSAVAEAIVIVSGEEKSADAAQRAI